MKSLSFVITLCATATAGVSAASALAAPSVRIAELAHSNGQQYVSLREQVLAQANFSSWVAAQEPRGWQEAVLLEALSLRAGDPTVEEPLQRLQGVNPTYYLRYRRPEPVVGRELLTLQLPAAILIERYQKTFALHPLHQASYPAHLSSAQVEQLADQERLAMRSALLFAVGKSGHRWAAPFLASVAQNPEADLVLRSIAARSIGDTQSGQADTYLRQLLDSEDLAVVTGAVQGAGKLRQASALGLLEQALNGASSTEVRQAALMGLAGYANARTWRGSQVKAVEQDRLRQGAATALANAVTRAWAPSVRAALVQALAAAAHPSLTPALQAIEAGHPSAEARAIAAQALELLSYAQLR